MKNKQKYLDIMIIAELYKILNMLKKTTINIIILIHHVQIILIILHLNAVIEYNYDSCIILSLIYSQFI
jgi:hypothetical protein